MFEVVVDLDPEEVRRADASGRSPYGTICLQWNGIAFPSPVWNDEVFPLLDEWLRSLRLIEYGLADVTTNHFAEEAKYAFTLARLAEEQVHITCLGLLPEPFVEFDLPLVKYRRALLKACRRAIAQSEAVSGVGTASGLRQAIAMYRLQ
jgi:hypothetical protein